jgi:hypothetical protein
MGEIGEGGVNGRVATRGAGVRRLVGRRYTRGAGVQ